MRDSIVLDNYDENANESSSSREISLTQKMLSASLGAMLTSLLVTPMDVVKVRLQVQGTNNINNNINVSTNVTSTASAKSTANPFTTSKSNNLPPPASGKYFFHNESYVFCNDFHDTVKPYRPISTSSSGKACSLKLLSSSDLAILQGQKDATIFKGTWDATKSILRNEGVYSLWRGLVPTLVMSVPATVVYYVGYDYWKNKLFELGQKDEALSQISYFSPLISGGLSRAIAATCISPLELVKTRIQAAPMNQSTLDIVSEISFLVKTNGLGVLWRGLSPTLWRDVPFSAIYWMGYESIKGALTTSTSTTSTSTSTTSTTSTSTLSTSTSTSTAPSVASSNNIVSGKNGDSSRWIAWRNSFIAGASSGIIAATLTTPFDVAKTRRQVDNFSSAESSSSNAIASASKKYSVFSAIIDIWKEEGWRGLTRGLTARVAKVAPACAIMISSYELGKSIFLGDM